MTTTIPILTVFLQGLLSFLSPCVLPLLPVYMGYLSGGAAARDEKGLLRYPRGKVFINTVFFVLGISFAFLVLGLGMTAFGTFFRSHQTLLARIGGVIVILFGLYQLGIFGESAFLSTERRFRLPKLAASPLAALLMGFLFSFGWTPCIGPTLTSVLLLAGSAATQTKGLLLMGVYTLGFVLPFLAVGLFTTGLLSLLKKHRNLVKYTVKIGAVLMILLGVMMITGWMNSITGYLSRFGPAADPAETAARSVDSPESTEEASLPAESTGEGAATEAPAEAKQLAPDLTLTDQYGVSHTLSDYRGKVVFLNFWATWCPPCRAEMPDIQALYEEYAAREDPEVVILAVATPGVGGEEDEAGVKAFLEENGYTYPVLMDSTGRSLGSYAITAFPTTFLITREGEIQGYVPGMMTAEVMADVIRQTLEAE